ncbi:MAG TPA: hypothetical protein VL069_12790 [Opitutus sp.]|nr:hypothetical protein [Opitutus sp.]
MENRTADIPPSVPSNPPVRLFVARTLLIGLLVFVVLAITHRGLLFVQPHHEYGDFAVDAMNTERARHFQAIHGNFSRFEFRHPGPAFNYVYALGEEVFYHWWHLVPSRYNAHALAGLILQCFFYGAALAIADQWIRRPLFIPLTLLTTTIHLSLAGNAFVGTWQPHGMLMPFFCFVVGAASVAGGQIRHLPLTVLAGCFLVHGHVAQPLFVVPLFLLAWGAAWSRARRQPGGAWWRENRAAHLVSAGCIAVFLVPLMIDLSAGAQSNLARILEFQSYDHGPGKPLWKALVYFCAFFGYVKKTEGLLSVVGPDRASAIGEHVAGYFIWAAIIVVALVHARRVWLRPAAVERPFVLALTAFTFLAFLLSLYWGTLQIGAMYEYNGYFFHAILSCILILLCAAISQFTLPRTALVGTLLCTVAAALAWQWQHAPLKIDYRSNHLPPAVEQALKSDPLPAAPKYLVFRRDDWGEAVSIGIALKRAHLDFRANADWGPKFMPDGGFEPVPPDYDLQGMSTWRLSRLGPNDVGSPIIDDLRVYFEPLPLDPTSAVIDCANNGNLELYNLFGFASPFGSAAWTIRPHAGLVFNTPSVSSDLAVTFFAEPFAVTGKPAVQPMSLSVNGRDVFTGILTARGSVTARVPAEVWNLKKPVMMVMHLPAAVSPRQLGLSLDQRMFGWHIERIVFESVR